MCEGLTYNFVREEIKKKCDEYELLTEQIKYLECVLREYTTNPPELDENIGLVPTLEDWIESHLRWRKFLVENPESSMLGIVKMKGVISIIVRIFETMIEADILSKTTQLNQIARLFFSEKADVLDFQNNYSARKTEIYRGETSTTDKRMMEFVKKLIANAFEGREKQINELRSYLETIKY